ncbi:MAG: hypothetical protein ACD_41C00031G0007 [uncultured bacterium]|nr:MAG: hypothetical protein ACD_41C00031G0007 [uncultured bacterium]HBY73875.1 hypothetical protein [Candidatus Kerfeldbacteria bacterium]
MKWYRLVLGAVIMLSFSYAAYAYVGGDGTLELTYNFRTTPQAIDLFGPHGRALDREENLSNGETYQRIVNGPAYTTVTLPGAYDAVTVQLEYQNPSQTLVELGVKRTADPELFDYTLQPLENKLVDNSDWDRIENDQYILLQRDPTYTSIEEFLAKPPTTVRGGSYLISPDLAFTDPSYQANSTNGSHITTTLRGAHEFYTYAAAETLTVQVTVEDINYTSGEDPVTVALYQQDQFIAQEILADDGEIGITGQSTGPRSLQLAVPNVTDGVYHIKVETNDDILITAIQSDQERFVISKSIHLAGSEEYVATGAQLNLTPTTLQSDSNWLTVVAKHPYGVGDLTMYNRLLHVNKVNTPYTWINPIPQYDYAVTIPQNDTLALSDSYFALPGAEAFDPWFGLRPISQYTDPDGLSYVLSGQYTGPTRLRSWTTATATFDLTGIDQRRPNELEFLLSAPGLETTSLGIKVRSITVVAVQHPITITYLWKKIFGN